MTMARGSGFSRTPFLNSWFYLTLLLCTLSLPCRAQIESATLSGRVTTESGEPIRNALVTATQIISTTSTSTHTNAQGVYLLTGLTSGIYRVSVQRFGFKVTVHSDVHLHMQSQVSENLVMELGYSSETVSSRSLNWSGAPAPTASALLDRNFPSEIPLNGRSFQPLLKLTPGHVTAATYFTSPGQSSIDGRRTTENYTTVDGVSVNFGVAQGADVTLGEGAGESLLAVSVVGGTNSVVSLDEIEELRIQGSSYSPQYGRLPGAQIAIITRSGTNEFHGKLFEYFRNDALDAADWFSKHNGLGRARESQDDFGFTASGPLWRRKAYFFNSQEWLRLIVPQTRAEYVPSLSAREDAPSSIQPLLNAFPQPNRPATNSLLGIFATNPENLAHLSTTSARFDWTPAEHQSYFLRGSYSPSYQSQRGAFNFYTTSTTSVTDVNVLTLTLGATTRFNGSSYNDLRLGLSTYRSGTLATADGYGGATPAPLNYLFSSYPTAASPASNFVATLQPDINGLYEGRDVDNRQTQWTLVDGLHGTFGSHELSVGLDARWLLPVNAYRRYTGAYAFNGIAGALNAMTTTAKVETSESGDIHLRFRNTSLFAQDTWRVAPSLTLTYGLRWESDATPGSSAALPLRTVRNLDNPADLVLAPASAGLWQADQLDLAPRFGVAYQFSRAPGWETQLRGSFGIFYGLASSAASRVAQGAPYLTTTTYTNTSFPLTTSQAAPSPAILSTPYSLLYAFPQDLHAPRVAEWNAGVEQRLDGQMMLLVNYVGSSGSRLLHREVLLPAEGLNPDFTMVEVVNNHARSSYQSMQVLFERKFGRGPGIWSTYTLSKSLDTVSSMAHPAPYYLTYDPAQDYGPSEFDVRHNFSTTVTFSLPTPRQRLAKAILGAWSVTGLTYLSSAMPVNVLTGTDLIDLTYTKSYYQRPNRNPGVPLYLLGKQYPGGKALNPSAFSAVTNTFQGNLGRNALRGFGMFQQDISVEREIRFKDGFAAQFRAEVLNLTNHPNFGNPGTGSTNTNVLNAAGFGMSSMSLAQSLGTGGADGGFNPIYQTGGPRAIQLVLRLIF